MTKQQVLRSLITKSGCATQKEFAEKHGKIPNQISEWMHKKRDISIQILQEIAKTEGYKLQIDYKLEKIN